MYINDFLGQRFSLKRREFAIHVVAVSLPIPSKNFNIDHNFFNFLMDCLQNLADLDSKMT